MTGGKSARAYLGLKCDAGGKRREEMDGDRRQDFSLRISKGPRRQKKKLFSMRGKKRILEKGRRNSLEVIEFAYN